MPAGLVSALFSGMWHGYRRWMTLFNSLSIVLSVTLAMVILGFTHGVREYVDDTVRKEAAAGAVRIHAGGWQTGGEDESFHERVLRADEQLRAEAGEEYLGFNFWWRSEAHYLMPGHPAESKLAGVFVKTGNTFPADPEAARVAPFAIKGRWVSDPEAAEIVLSSAAAVKLAKRIEEITAVEELVGRKIWITLPPTREHLAAACAQVDVVGVFEHLRDGACMTTPSVVQAMHARTQANAYGKWYETYDRMTYAVQALVVTDGEGSGPGGELLGARLAEGREVPVVCWRSREDAGRWVSLRGSFARRGEDEVTRSRREEAALLQGERERTDAVRSAAEQALQDVRLVLQGSDQTVQWLADLDAAARAAFADEASADAAVRLQDMVTEASAHLRLEMDTSSVTSPAAYAVFHGSVTDRIAATTSSLREQAEALEAERTAAALKAQTLAERREALLKQADERARQPILGPGSVVQLDLLPGGGDTVVVAGGVLVDELPASEHTHIEALDRLYPGGYVLVSPRIWDELGYAAAPGLPVDEWRRHALYAYLYFDGLQPALVARERLKQWGFTTYMPIDRFQGLLALVRVVTWAAVALLAAVLLAGLLGIVVTLYTEVDAEEAEIGLLKALGASNRLVGLVFLGKGALVGMVGVAAGVPLAWFVTGRINQGVSGAVARAAGLTDTDAGLFSQDPGMVLVAGAAIVCLAALAALMPALQAAGKDPQEALRAE